MIVLVTFVETSDVAVIQHIAVLIYLEQLGISKHLWRIDTERNHHADVVLTGKIAQCLNLLGV